MLPFWIFKDLNPAIVVATLRLTSANAIAARSEPASASNRSTVGCNSATLGLPDIAKRTAPGLAFIFSVWFVTPPPSCVCDAFSVLCSDFCKLFYVPRVCQRDDACLKDPLCFFVVTFVFKNICPFFNIYYI